eukprot:TRINITY_DN59044_c0_g1_i1.p1 TRINITY_DN59044_c0_g1~~TRINITY_DN59044_c0_g1_i1.p1  ORF type:complete len:858 (+),score=312.55 TRINITY_DN59044_c0_g1_i1:39-2612(+)
MADATRGLPVLRCSPDKRIRLSELVKAYFDQLKHGCGYATCENVHCRTSAKFGHSDKTDQALFDESKTLARSAFRESPVYYFCGGYCFPLPAANLRIGTPEDFPAGEGELTFEPDFFKQAVENIDAAQFLFYDIQRMRQGTDIYEEGRDPTPLFDTQAGAPRDADAMEVDGDSASPFAGCSLGLDLPAVRASMKRLQNNEGFESAVAQLAGKLKRLSQILPRSSEELQAVDTDPVSFWKETLDREKAQLGEAASRQAYDRHKCLNSFLTLRLARLVVILLECPFVRDSHTVLCDVCVTVGRLHSHIAEPLLSIYAQYPAGPLQDVVQALQSFITLSLLQDEQLLRTDPRFNTNIPAACIVLSILYEANYSAQPKGILGHQHFYNDGINEYIDAKMDFDQYYRSEGDGSARAILLGMAQEEVRLERTTLQQSLLSASRVFRKGHPGLPEQFAVSQFPFLLNAAFKHSLLQHHSLFQQQNEIRRTLLSHHTPTMPMQIPAEALFLVLKIDREDLLESTLRELNRNREKVRSPLRVEFKGEEGIDEGGVKKEFFQLLVRQLVDPSFGMFTEDKDTNVHWFQPRVVCSTSDIEYHLIGKVIGLAIYNQVILDVNFPHVVFKKLLYIDPVFADVAGIDPVLHKSLKMLLEFDESRGEGTVEDIFCRSFVVAHEVFGEQLEVELKPGGSDIPVTAQNRAEYVELYTQYVCTVSLGKNFDEFRNGFYEVCGRQTELLRAFHPEELERMVVGSPDFDLSDLEPTTRYDGYDVTDSVVQNFWSILKEMNLDEQRMFLKFTTGTDRLPIRGLKSLNFVIGKNGGDSEQLPTAHTCFNHLLIPEYTSRDKLKEKLMTAIRNCQGFGLM